MSELTVSTLEEKLPAIRKYVAEVLDENESHSVYTNIGRLYRLEKNIRKIIAEDEPTHEQRLMLDLALYTDMIVNSTNKQKEFDLDLAHKHGVKTAAKIAKKFDLPEEISEHLKNTINQFVPGVVPDIYESKVIQDAILMEFTGDKWREHLKAFYEEMLLRDMNLGQAGWYDNLIGIMESMQVATAYGKEHIQPDFDKALKKLKKEKKEIEGRTSLLLKKELNISEEELKKLRKDINKAKNRDERGIQTLFRTTIKNHYTLNEMVDRKASIMITVNSIILSLVMGGVIGDRPSLKPELLPVALLSITSILSIIFAVFAIRPLRTQGDFTEEEIRNKEGNLLYFGNFFNMHFRDFEWGFLQMLNDKNYLYLSMIRDFYYQGVGLSRKYKHIRLSLTIFLFGFGISFLMFVIVGLASHGG